MCDPTLRQCFSYSALQTMIIYRSVRIISSVTAALAAATMSSAIALPIIKTDTGNAIRWRDTVTVASGGWGRMIHLTNGSWLSVGTQYPDQTTNTLHIVVSKDNTRIWKPLSRVEEPGRRMDNGELIQLKNGTVLLTGRDVVDGESYRFPVYKSTDNGATWTFISVIDANNNVVKGGPSQGLWEPHFFVLADGRLAAAYANEKHSVDVPSYSQVCSMRISPDNGSTWGPEIVMVSQPGGGNLRPGMPVVSRMKNGKFIEVSEVVGENNADVYAKISNDGWHWPSGLGTKIPLQHAGPWVMSLADGRVIVTSCSNEYSLSSDYGNTWVRIDSPYNCGFVWTWPALYQIGPSTVGGMVTHGEIQLRYGTLNPQPAKKKTWSSDFGSAPDVGWTHYGGSFAVQGGVYAATNAQSESGGMSLTGDTTWGNGTFTSNVTLRSSGSAGLMFRTTNANFSTAPHDNVGLSAAHGYAVVLDSSGRVILDKVDDGLTQLQSRPLDVTIGRPYRVKITAMKSRIVVYVDDMNTPRIVVRDNEFKLGQIGVIANASDAEFSSMSYREK